jgi:hypothetical protein
MDPRPALEDAIRTLRAEKAFLPVAVVVPQHLFGVWLGRSIFRDTGHMAIEFVLPHELAWKVAAPGLLREGRARLPENVGLAMLLGAIPDAVAEPATPEYLREAVTTAGFAPAALRTIEDLAAALLQPDDLDAVAPGAADPERLRLLARLWRGLTKSLDQARLLDRSRLYAAAAKALPSPTPGAVVLCGRHDLPPSAAAFLDALANTHPFRTVGGASEGTPAPSMTVLSAAGEALEAVEIARAIQQAADEGVRHEEMAVLLRNPDTYDVALASAFERAGIDALFVEGVPRVDPAARSLSLMLDLVGADLDRARVMEFLTSARIRWAEVLGPDADVSPARWDRLSAQAGIVSGLDSWRKRLAQAKEDREARKYDDDRDLRLYDSLARLVERLAADLATLPTSGPWSGHLDATLGLLDRWIDRAGLTRERLERVLRPLGEYAPPPTREEFLARTRELLATQRYREGQLGDGRVFVGSIDSARGLRFRLVFVPGLVERAFPGLVRPDPLLLDDERQALSPHLRTSRDGQEAERQLFADAVSAAEERLVLSYPRFDTASGRERVPSSFLLRALEAALGRRVDATELARIATPGATALGRPHPEDPALAVDVLERDLALVASGQPGAARHLSTPDGFLVRSLAQERAAWDAALTAWDGLVDGGDAQRLCGAADARPDLLRLGQRGREPRRDRGRLRGG